jgi:hypothetical protein
MKLVQQFGVVYKMSDRAYKRMLKVMSENDGTGPTWDELGAKCLGYIDLNTTDITAERAKEALADLKAEG